MMSCMQAPISGRHGYCGRSPGARRDKSIGPVAGGRGHLASVRSESVCEQYHVTPCPGARPLGTCEGTHSPCWYPRAQEYYFSLLQA